MLSRLILILLCACLAVPAMASVPCHDAMPGMAAEMAPGMMGAHDAPAPASAPDHKAVAVHACLGCIPPATLLRAGLAAPVLAKAMLTATRGKRFDAGRESPPATPPPRG